MSLKMRVTQNQFKKFEKQIILKKIGLSGQKKIFSSLPKKFFDIQNFSHKSKTFTKLVNAQILLILHAFRKLLHILLCSAVILSFAQSISLCVGRRRNNF